MQKSLHGESISSIQRNSRIENKLQQTSNVPMNQTVENTREKTEFLHCLMAIWVRSLYLDEKKYINGTTTFSQLQSISLRDTLHKNNNNNGNIIASCLSVGGQRFSLSLYLFFHIGIQDRMHSFLSFFIFITYNFIWSLPLFEYAWNFYYLLLFIYFDKLVFFWLQHRAMHLVSIVSCASVRIVI